MFVSTSRTETLAPATTAPLLSVTVQHNVERPSCPRMAEAQKTTTTAARGNEPRNPRAESMKAPPDMLPPRQNEFGQTYHNGIDLSRLSFFGVASMSFVRSN